MLVIATLIFVGILLMLIELLLVTGVGIAGILGLASLVGSCVYAFVEIGTKAGIFVTLGVILITSAMVFFILRSKTWKKMELNTEIDSKVNEGPEQVKAGEEGVAVTRLAPMGTVRFTAVTCEAKSLDNSIIASGTKVVVETVEDNKVIVKPIN